MRRRCDHGSGEGHRRHHSGIATATRSDAISGLTQRGRAVNDLATDVVQTVLSRACAKGAEGMVTMPSFGDASSDSEISAVANHVAGRFGAAPSRLTALDIHGFDNHLSAE